MKTTNFFNTLLLLAAGSLLLTGCDNKKPNDDPGNEDPIVLTVNLTPPTGYEISELPAVTVTAVNADKDLTYTEILEAGVGTVDFEVSSGQYQITASGRYSQTVTFTGGAIADVFASKAAIVVLSEVYKSPLVFKEVYNTSQGWKLNDTYVEIVNNSDEVQYLDQVFIGSIMKLTAPNPWVDGDGNMLAKYPLYGVMAAFPGSGTEYPLQPGESVVVANDGKDWTSEGATDLSGADWECYVPDAGQADTDYDVRNIDIPYNLEKQRRFGTGFFGGGLILAKIPAGTPWPKTQTI